MAGKGGYQAPSKPAPASNPGAGSRRTDGGLEQKLRDLPDADYGENAEFVNSQRAAPLAQVPVTHAPSPSGGGAGGPDLMSMATPINAPSARPNEPVTAGAAIGPGAGPDALNLPNQGNAAMQSARDYVNAIASTSSNPAVQYLAAAIQGAF